MGTFVKGKLAVLSQDVTYANPLDQRVLFLGIYPQDIPTHVHEDTKVQRSAIFQFATGIAGEWLNKTCYSHSLSTVLPKFI